MRLLASSVIRSRLSDLMFTHTSDSRMQLVGIGDLMHPGACMVCGSGNREQGYVNLGVYYEYEGNMYLCFLCLTEAAEIIGMLTSDEAHVLNENSSKVFEENVALKEELASANERLSVYDNAMRAIVSANPGSAVASADSTKGEGQVSLVGADVHSGANAGEPEPAESVKSNKPAGTSRIKRSNPAALDHTESGSTLQL